MPKILRKPRIYARRYKDLFEHERYIPFLRARAQCEFRHEPFELTFEDWCAFWSTPDLWARRGRDTDSLSLMRIDVELPWSRSNCCLMNRRTQIAISNKRNNGCAWEHLLKDAVYV